MITDRSGDRVSEQDRDIRVSDAERDAMVRTLGERHSRAVACGWLVSILSNSIHTARPQAVGTLNRTSILGGGEIDLRNVEVEGSELAISSFSLLGGATLYRVPAELRDRPAKEIRASLRKGQ
jgi:hypothetical protein